MAYYNKKGIETISIVLQTTSNDKEISEIPVGESMTLVLFELMK